MTEEAIEIFVLEDEANLRELIRDVLQGQGLQVQAFDTIAGAQVGLARRSPDLLLLDVRLPDGDGLAFLETLRSGVFRGPAIVMTAFGTLERAVQALRAGAADFLVKPFDNERLRSSVAAALHAAGQSDELAMTAGRVEARAGAARPIVGERGGLEDVLAVLPRIAASEATVLIRGESGTGKELIAREIHARSARLDGPFVSLNCAALPPTLLEAELFGFERGAFTGAHARRKGHIEAAEGGTLFLDEIGDMSPEAQARLLRVLQERELTRIGGRDVVRVDVRVIAATHRDLEQLAASGQFRSDLLYRLDVISVKLPPLRDRRGDIPGLIEHFVAKHALRHRASAPHPTAQVLAFAAQHAWPGNVRELENFVERAVVLGRFEIPAVEAPAPSPSRAAPIEVGGVRTLRAAVAEAERAAVVAALKAAGGNKAQAARLLGVSYKTLFNKIHEHDVREDLHIG